jgi:endonuclease/exonuclease/phosphatase family metal-dependent hydrolase
LVLMGDFNCPAGAPEMRVLYQRTRLAEPVGGPPSFPSWAPERSLDHILVAGFQVDGYQALPAAGSDHLAMAISLH